MSNYILTAVWRHSRAQGAARLVLLSLADQANDAGWCRVSIENIAKRCLISVRSVHRHLDTLVELNEVARRVVAGRSSDYQVLVENLCQPDTPAKVADPETSANVTQASANLTPPPLPPVADGSATAGRQNHSLPSRRTTSSTTADAADEKKPIDDQAQAPAAAAPQPDGIVERLCDHLASRIEANGIPKPKVTPAWRAQCRLLLDSGPTEEQVRAVIDWCQADTFWAPNILSMSKLRARFAELQLRSRNQQTTKDRNAAQDAEAEARRLRARRIAVAPDPIPPAHLSGAEAAIWLRDARRRIASGERVSA